MQLEPWDWDYLSRKALKAEHDLNEEIFKPYFEFENVLQKGVFYVAYMLYGLVFKERKDLPTYHPDVRVFNIIQTSLLQSEKVALQSDTPEEKRKEEKIIGIFYGDYYARENKKGGAWMNSFVEQSYLLDQAPIITQNCNFVKPGPGQPTLLNVSEVVTLFHEFGHALHGMLSEQKYPYFSGTNTSTDFVEFPSQLNENWAMHTDVLNNYARHYQTGEIMPENMLKNIQESKKWNQGYLTSEYLQAAILDIEWHSLSVKDFDSLIDPLTDPSVGQLATAESVDLEEIYKTVDFDAIEERVLKHHGIYNRLIPPRYKTSYFSHIWDIGYSSNYYAYMWAEILDADAFEWFMENGGLNRELGSHFRKTVLSQGGSRDGMVLYKELTGREPTVNAMFTSSRYITLILFLFSFLFSFLFFLSKKKKEKRKRKRTHKIDLTTNGCISNFKTNAIKLPHDNITLGVDNSYINTEHITRIFITKLVHSYRLYICLDSADKSYYDFPDAGSAYDVWRKFIDEELIPSFQGKEKDKEKIRKMAMSISKLRKKVTELETTLKYMPGVGTEYRKAQQEFTSLATNVDDLTAEKS